VIHNGSSGLLLAEAAEGEQGAVIERYDNGNGAGMLFTLY